MYMGNLRLIDRRSDVYVPKTGYGSMELVSTNSVFFVLNSEIVLKNFDTVGKEEIIVAFF